MAKGLTGNIRANLKGAATCAVALLVLCLLAACSTKKNTAASRQWQAFNTRYNVYYNGAEHYRETLKEMESKYEDDYTRTLLTHPAEARADAKLPQPSGDFKRTIEKMQKAIQLHSIKKRPAKKGSSKKEKEFRARDEFNPFLHNAWMMMGKAQFNNGDFLGAASTFYYIARHFRWLPATATEATLWEAYSYCAMNWLYEAENALHGVKEKDLTSSSLRNFHALVEADYLVRSERYKEAIAPLTVAAKAAKGSQRNRLYFLLGQCYSAIGDKAGAYQAYKKAGAGVSTAYRTKFNARIKQSEVFTGNNIKGEVSALKSMARYQRNSEFLDQIYYAIGNLYLSRGDTAKAKENYMTAIDKSTRNGIDKALAQLALGAIYFREGDYVKAQPCYSEAVPRLSDNYPGYKMLKTRSDVLDQLATYAGNVQLQDSLLRLSQMSPEEQLAVCQKIADELKKKEKEEAEAAKREEYLADQAANGNQNIQDPNAPQKFELNTDKSWYFYNPTTVNSGKTEFQRKWGARKLEDDWRRRNKTSFAFDQPDESAEAADSVAADAPEMTEEEKSAAQKASDPHFAEYYMKQIPRTDAEKKTSNDVIQEGLYNMGVILKDRLEDFPAARKEFIELDTRYPDNIYRLDAYYNLYLMAVRQGNESEADRWRDKIIADFPDSPYGVAMKDPLYFDKLRQMHARQEKMYQQAYDAYLDNDNKEVHALTADMERDYPLSSILPKFVFIDALSYLTEKDYTQFEERLKYLLQKWPDTDMTDVAGGIVRRLGQGWKPQGGMSNQRGMIWDMRLTNDSTLLQTGADGQPAAFERDPSKPQYLVFAFSRDSVNANQVLYDVARFNFSSFTVRDFDLEPMSFGNVGLLVVKGFANQKELDRYRDVLAKSNFRIPEGVRPIPISKANFELLLSQGRSFEEYFRFQEEEPEPPLPDGVIPSEEETDEAGGETPPGSSEETPEETPDEVPDEIPDETSGQ